MAIGLRYCGTVGICCPEWKTADLDPNNLRRRGCLVRVRQLPLCRGCPQGHCRRPVSPAVRLGAL